VVCRQSRLQQDRLWRRNRDDGSSLTARRECWSKSNFTHTPDIRRVTADRNHEHTFKRADKLAKSGFCSQLYPLSNSTRKLDATHCGSPLCHHDLRSTRITDSPIDLRCFLSRLAGSFVEVSRFSTDEATSRAVTGIPLIFATFKL
jgi:hypothetical protein